MLICLLLAALSGCGSFQQLIGATPSQKYERALERHHYRQAIALAQRALQEQSASNTDQADSQVEGEVGEQNYSWQQKLEAAQQRAQVFETEEIKAINAMLPENQWTEVDSKLSFLMRYLPETEAIDQLRNTAADRRKHYIQQLKRQLLQHEVASVPKAVELYNQLHEADVSNTRTLRQRKVYLKQNKRLIAQLDKQFADAERRGDIQEAIYLGKQLAELSPSESLSIRLDELKAALASKVAKENERAANQRAAVRATNQKALLDRYNLAIEESRWLDAKDMIAEILKLSPNDKDWLARSELLQSQLDQVVESGRHEGEALYADGNIEAALQVWEEALKLVPDDQKLRANIERAQRILTKIESIKNDQ